MSPKDWARGGDYWPNMTTVVDVFGKWSAALTAAGYEPNYHMKRREAAVSEREPQAEEARGCGAAHEPTASTPPAASGRASSRSETATRDLLDDLYGEAAA